jgi:hypothetical protein
MGTEELSKPKSRAKTLLVLAAFVVVSGLGSWLTVGGGISRLTSHAPTPTPSPSPLPRFPACGANEIKLTGAFDDCALLDLRFVPFPCSQLGQTLDAVVELHGAAHAYLLYVNVDGGYTGPRAYSLRPWPHPYLHANDDAAKVAVREVVAGALWQSTAGTLNITGKDGRSGSVIANLTPVGGEPTPPTTELHISGPWSCG